MLCNIHIYWYSWKQSHVWQCACLRFSRFVLYYSIKVKRRDIVMGSIEQTTGEFTLSQTTGVAFIRDNFVD